MEALCQAFSVVERLGGRREGRSPGKRMRFRSPQVLRSFAPARLVTVPGTCSPGVLGVRSGRLVAQGEGGRRAYLLEALSDARWAADCTEAYQ
jgi:hypothetical protein